jgi:hypothetical protein
MSELLTVLAGPQALVELREGGWNADAFSTLLGASGGPKWLVLSRMDRVLAEQFVSPRTRPLAVVGSSIGTFRHLCHAQKDPIAALERFEEAYIAQAYEAEPTPREVSRESERVVEILFGALGRQEVLANASIATHIIAVRSRAAAASDRRLLLAIGLGAAAVANAIDRRLLAAFFERAVFHTGGSSRLGFTGFGTQNVPLTPENLEAAALASGSIPLVMDGVDSIAEALPGRYRDGGIVDYHFDFEFEAPKGLILYPHFFDRITPGWFDKSLAWRRPRGAALERTVLVAPSHEFVASLPGARVPDRNDFRELSTADRQRRWREVVDRCGALADRLNDLLASGRIGQVARPFS